jgi:acyl-CoA thioesterase
VVSPEATDGSTPGDLARRSAQAMWDDDVASRRLGMEILAIAPGRSEVAMTVRDDMVNGHGLCHGGLVATLADSAFALACNTYGEVTVASGFDIDLLEPAHLGDRLVARAVERVRRGRSGIYDVTVRHGDRIVAEFRGRSRSLGRPILEGSTDPDG